MTQKVTKLVKMNLYDANAFHRMCYNKTPTNISSQLYSHFVHYSVVCKTVMKIVLSSSSAI